MEVEAVLTAVSTVGFPIAAYLLLHFKMTRSIENNTNAINQLKDMIEQTHPKK